MLTHAAAEATSSSCEGFGDFEAVFGRISLFCVVLRNVPSTSSDSDLTFSDDPLQRERSHAASPQRPIGLFQSFSSSTVFIATL